MNEFKKVDSVQYVQKLLNNGADIITAHKTAPVLAELLTEPRLIETYTSDGNLESSEYKQPGIIIVTAATRDGKPKIDQYGRTNTWPLDLTRFTKCFKTDGVDLSKPFNGLFYPQNEMRKFIQITDDIEFKTGWGTQFLRAGGYLNITDPKKGYFSGVAKAEFEESYDIDSIEKT